MDVAHAHRDVGIRCLDQQMIVVRHHAVRGDAKIPHLRGSDQHLVEDLIILLAKEDRITTSTAVHDVIAGIGEFAS
jgi:hypothetical protein